MAIYYWAVHVEYLGEIVRMAREKGIKQTNIHYSILNASKHKLLTNLLILTTAYEQVTQRLECN